MGVRETPVALRSTAGLVKSPVRARDIYQWPLRCGKIGQRHGPRERMVQAMGAGIVNSKPQARVAYAAPRREHGVVGLAVRERPGLGYEASVFIFQ
jgi:hypothetical protein